MIFFKNFQKIMRQPIIELHLTRNELLTSQAINQDGQPH